MCARDCLKRRIIKQDVFFFLFYTMTSRFFTFTLPRARSRFLPFKSLILPTFTLLVRFSTSHSTMQNQGLSYILLKTCDTGICGQGTQFWFWTCLDLHYFGTDNCQVVNQAMITQWNLGQISLVGGIV